MILFKRQIAFFKNLGLCLVIVICASGANAQSKIDSLKLAYDYSEVAEDRIQIQIQIAQAYSYEYNFEQAILEYQRAIEMIPNNQTDLKASTISRLGSTLQNAERVEEAKGAYKMSIQLYTSLDKHPDLVARNYSLLGRCFYDMSNYDSAMVYYLKAEEIFESNNIINRDYGMLFHFIGSVFKRQYDDTKACEYYHKEIEFGKKHNMKDIEAEGLYLSGICLESDSAVLANHLHCLELYKELDSKGHIGLMYQLIAGSYSTFENYDSTLYYQLLSLEIRRERNEISHLAGILADISKTYIKLGRLTEAKATLKEAEEVALRTGVKKHIRLQEIYNIRYGIALDANNYKDAIHYLTLTYAHRDSAMDSEHQNAIAEMAVKYDSDKQEAQLAILQKDKEIAQTEKELAAEAAATQSFYNKLVSGGGILLLLAGIFVYLKYRESQKQKIFISAQRREMQFQKELVEAKNKDITDSMVYASSIQQAIITSEEYLSKMFKEFFVFYKPRDIVSGDFYWAYETSDGTRLIAVGDCTGHGVPGAMMSMLGHAFLNEIVIEGNIHEPNQILNRLRIQVKRALQNNISKDGMDMSFCKIEADTITYAGANLPLYLLRNGELLEFKGDKQPVGYQPGIEKPFTQEIIQLQKGDGVYLFSDGYADQFGGEKGKKYKYKTFKDKLSLISNMSFTEQAKIIDTEFETWKGDLEQLDDVCVIGLRV